MTLAISLVSVIMLIQSAQLESAGVRLNRLCEMAGLPLNSYMVIS